jgi:GDP-L-fucose synthase
MKILITGASGFLGRFLSEKLKKNGCELTLLNSKNCDLTLEASLEDFNSTAYDQIFHLAAWTQAGDFCLHHSGEQWLMNQKINTHILAWWQKRQPQAKMICIGTSCSYDPNLPLSEEYYLQGTPISSLYTYAMTKRMLLIGLMALHRQFGLNYLYVIPSTLYGPSYHVDGRQLHFIFDLIRKILRGGTLYQDPVVLWGDGEQKRELIHVSDFVDALVALNQTEKNDWFNIGSGIEHSIKDFAHEICSHSGYKFSQIQFDLSKYVGARSKVLQVEKLKKTIQNFKPRDLKSGLKETIDWVLKEKDRLLR